MNFYLKIIALVILAVGLMVISYQKARTRSYERVIRQQNARMAELEREYKERWEKPTTQPATRPAP